MLKRNYVLVAEPQLLCSSFRSECMPDLIPKIATSGKWWLATGWRSTPHFHMNQSQDNSLHRISTRLGSRKKNWYIKHHQAIASQPRPNFTIAATEGGNHLLRCHTHSKVGATPQGLGHWNVSRRTDPTDDSRGSNAAFFLRCFFQVLRTLRRASKGIQRYPKVSILELDSGGMFRKPQPLIDAFLQSFLPCFWNQPVAILTSCDVFLGWCDGGFWCPVQSVHPFTNVAISTAECTAGWGSPKHKNDGHFWSSWFQVWNTWF